MPRNEIHATNSSSGRLTDFTKHRFGANYVPSKNWWYCWNEFDADAIARDFDAIASLGLDHLRVFPLWPVFQPNPIWVSGAHLERLQTLMHLASDRQLDVCVTPLTGWLSGYNFRPPFHGDESIYTSAKMIMAEELFLTELSKVLNPFDNFLGFDLGNEINCYQSATIADGDAWMARLLGHCNSISPGAAHVNGVDHQPWFFPHTFSPRALATLQQIVTLHCWIKFTGALDHGGPLDSPSVQLTAAMTALARAYAGDAAKPIWIQEFGASQEWMPAESQAKFLKEATFAAINAGASWFTWWCSHDIDPMFQFDALEYDLGLLTTGNTPKPHALALQDIAKEFSGKSVAIPVGQPLLPPPPQSDSAATWQWLLHWIELTQG